MDANLTSQLFIVIASLGSALIGTAGTLLVTTLSKRSEERKHFHELVVKAAVDEWNVAVRHTAFGDSFLPLAHTIAYNALIVPILLDKDVDDKRIRPHLERFDRLAAVLARHADAVSARANKAAPADRNPE